MQLAEAHQALTDGVAALRAACDSRADADTRIEALKLCEQLSRQLDQLSVELVAGLERDGVFTDRGYSRPSHAVADLLGWDLGPSTRRVRVAKQVSERVALDGQRLPAVLTDTAAMFAAGETSLRHVEVIADALGSPAAGRLSPQVWAAAEQQLAVRARDYRPRELAAFARDLITTLDQDGPEPEDDEQRQVNERLVAQRPGRAGGRITGVLDAPSFEALLTALDGLCTPPTSEDQRSLPQRRGDALAELCEQRLVRTQLVVTIPLAELETRARAGMLDHGDPLTPAQLRRIACDTHVIPIVLNGAGQPVDIGRASRVVPTHLRTAVAARDRGCAFPGCDRPPGWCEAHHLTEWQHGGPTSIDNLALMCRFHHRLVHHTEWTVNMTRAGPEFTPPKWIDPTQTPRRKPRSAPQTPAESVR
jgi:5-methylcytosine-specific restriction protein A